MCSMATAKGVLPTLALFFYSCSGRFCTDILIRVCGTMCFSKCMSAGNKSYGLFIVHCHSSKGFPYISGCSDWVRIAVWSFRIYIDQSHLHRT